MFFEFCDRFKLNPAETEIDDNLLLLAKGYFLYVSQCKHGDFDVNMIEYLTPTSAEQIAMSSYIRQSQFVLTQIDQEKCDPKKVLENKHIRERLNLKAIDTLMSKKTLTQEEAQKDYDDMVAAYHKEVMEEMKRFGGR